MLPSAEERRRVRKRDRERDTAEIYTYLLHLCQSTNCCDPDFDHANGMLTAGAGSLAAIQTTLGFGVSSAVKGLIGQCIYRCCSLQTHRNHVKAFETFVIEVHFAPSTS